MMDLESLKAIIEKRKKPFLVSVENGLMVEKKLVNSFHMQPRIYFSDYLKLYTRGLAFPEDACTRQHLSSPVKHISEGLDTGDQVWEHPDYAENDMLNDFTSDTQPWLVFRIKGSSTIINRTIFSSFSKLASWALELASFHQVKIVELSTKYMLYSSRKKELAMPLKGDLVALQGHHNVYVHLIPEISFYQLRDESIRHDAVHEHIEPVYIEPVMELHPDLLAMFNAISTFEHV